MALWYYLQKGRPFGPVSADEIKVEIAAGRIAKRDLLYLERDTQWREASHFIEFNAAFPKNDVQPVTSEDSWVLLTRKPDGSGYRQRGPFSKSQIQSFLKNGEIAYTDYVWKKGLKEWYKILALPDFHDSKGAEDRALPPLPSDMSELSADLSEITMKLPLPQEDRSSPPPEAVTGVSESKGESTKVERTDASNEKKPNTKIKKRIRRTVKSLRQNPVDLVRRIGIVNYYLELTPVKKLVFGSTVIVVLASGLFLLTYTSSYLDRRKGLLQRPNQGFVKATPEVTRSGAPAPSNSSPTSAPAEPPPAAKTPPAPRVLPTYLKYSRISNGSEDARLKILTDASHHFALTAEISSEGGQVLDARSAFRKVTIKGDQPRELSFKELKLPPGHYTVALKADELKTEARLDFAVQTAEFKTKIRSHRKRLIHFHNEERYGFVKTATRLENEAFKLAQNVENAANLQSWTGFYRHWRSRFDRIKNDTLKVISGRNRHRYIHAAKWLELKDLRKQIDAEAKRLNRDKLKKNPVDAANIKVAAVKLTRLKEQMLQESLWRND